jgi:hypothetical protein
VDIPCLIEEILPPFHSVGAISGWSIDVSVETALTGWNDACDL